MKIIIVKFTNMIMPAIFKLRHDVFVIEQKVPLDLEIDKYDKEAEHIAVIANNIIVGTLRIVNKKKCVKIGRLAVEKKQRKKGIGTKMMKVAIAHVIKKGIKTIKLDAQIAVLEFYKKLGFVEEGKIFLDAGIKHITMKLNL